VTTFWDYFWPLLAAGLAIGALAGAIGFRIPKDSHPSTRVRWVSLGIGVFACAVAAATWSGPLGAADRLTARIEHDARLTIENYEIPQVTAHLHRAPLSRTLEAAGAANDFQRRELVRILGLLSGVRDVRWTANRGGVPLIAESVIATLAGFLFGLLLAYFVELRRRYNSQWNW
jgi:hypothetical protein